VERVRRILVAAGLLLFAACAAGPGPGDTGYTYNVDGHYSGRLMVEGTPFDADFDLRTTPAGRVYGTFSVRAPLEVQGELSGRILDDLLRATLSYQGDAGSGRDCVSVVDGILTVSPGCDVVDGPVTVDDCGDSLSGRMSIRRAADDA